MNNDDPIMKVALAQFPKVFGLRGFPGDRFTISEQDSYMADDRKTAILYVHRLNPEYSGLPNSEWHTAFSKCTVAELKREMVVL